MSATPTVRRPRRRAVAGLAALALPVMALTGGCAETGESMTPQPQQAQTLPSTVTVSSTASPQPDPEKLGEEGGKAFSIVVHITNNSSKTLIFVRNDKSNIGSIDPAPAATIAPNGGTDTYFYTSANSEGGEIDVFYRVDGSETTVEGFFQVPTVHITNNVGCTPTVSVCDIEKFGYHPNAHWTISNV